MHKIIGLVIMVLISSMAIANPCMPIAKACMKEGYYKGGSKEGKGLIKDCVMPVLSNEKSFPGITFSDETRQQCDAKLKQSMKNQ